MKPRRIEVRLAPLPRTYSPGYPRRLCAEEFEALIGARNHSRVRELLGPACVALLAAAAHARAAQRAPAPSGDDATGREARVLAVLQSFADSDPDRSWFWRSSMAPHSDPQRPEKHVYVPEIPIMFGNSYTGLFDAGAARRLASELFRAYGVEVELGVQFDTPTVKAGLDGANAAAKIAFELRAGTEVDLDAVPIDPDPPNLALSDAEREELERGGWKLHVVSAALYQEMDGDQLTPTVAYLAGVLEFLNAVTDGPDLDPRALLLGQRLRFATPNVEELGLGKRKSQGDWQLERQSDEFALTERRQIRIAFSAPNSPPSKSEPRHESFVFREREKPPGFDAEKRVASLSVLEAPVQAKRVRGQPDSSQREKMRVRLIQRRADRPDPLAIEARGPLIFAPMTFDPTQPFELEFDLPPGDYLLASGLDVSVLAP
jgi:hypothetical protein